MKNYEFYFKVFACIMLFFHAAFVHAQQHVTHIYTNYNSVTHSNDGFWSSGVGSISSVVPDNSHELIAFKYNNNTYSTGVDTITLKNNIGNNFVRTRFQAFPMPNIIPSQSLYQFAAGLDGSIGTPGESYNNTTPDPDIYAIPPFSSSNRPTLFDIMNYGVQGLDMSKSMANLGPSNSHYDLPITSMNSDILESSVPIIITNQTNDIHASAYDVVFFIDDTGTRIGNDVAINWKAPGIVSVGNLYWDVFNNNASLAGIRKKPVYFWAATISDFGITSENINSIKGLRYKVASTPAADLTFIAYNTALIQVTKAIADVSNTTENTPVTIDVLDNDSYSATANLTITITSQGSKGVAVVNPDNTITYTPNSNASGNDTFSYQIHDDVTGANSTANVNVIIENNFWIGNLNTSWSNTANWTAGIVPAAGSNIIFATVTNYGTAAKHDLFLDHDRSVGNVIIKTATAKLRIPAGKCLTVKGIIDTDASSDRIVLEAISNVAGASLIFPNENNPVYATVNMWSKAYIGNESTIEKYRWQYFGIPLHTLQAYPTFTGSVLREFNETETQVGKQWMQLKDASVLQAFKGYEISQPEAKMLTFQGALVKNNYSETQIMSSGAVNPGYHLLSNPYTAAIDITKIAFGEGMDKTVYLFNTGGRSDWNSHSGTFGNSTGQYLAVPQNLAQYTGQSYIPSMQGFFVRALTASDNTVSINYATAVVKNQHALRAPSPNSEEREKVYSAISLTSDNYEDLVLLFTEPDCSNSFDNGWDGYKMNLNEVGTSLSVVQADGNYQINSTNDINGTELAFKASDIDLNYTLSFKHVNLQNAYQKLYLIDKEMGKTIDVSEDGSQYNFTSKNNASARNRFTIITRKTSDGSETKDIVLSQKNRLLIVDNKSEHDGIIGLYDLSGRLMAGQRIGANLITTLSLTEFQQGVYIVKTDYGTKRKSDKIMIE